MNIAPLSLPPFNAAAATPTPLGAVVALEGGIQRNPKAEDFATCGDAILGGSGKCFRTLAVSQAPVSLYNQSTCGTGVTFVNLGDDQSEDNCRDGFGLVGTDPDNAPIIQAPQGIFYHRQTTPEDTPAWFFQLTPATPPLRNASAQLQMTLQIPGETNVTCVAEFAVAPLGDASGPLLGFNGPPAEPAAEPLAPPPPTTDAPPPDAAPTSDAAAAGASALLLLLLLALA